MRGCFSNGIRHQHDVQLEFAACVSGLLPFAACTVLGCCWHRLFNKSLHQPNPRRSLPLTCFYRQHASANLNLCLSPLKKNGGRHQFVNSGCIPCLVNLLHHSFRWMPENRQPPPFGYSKLPVTTNQPGSVFQYQVLRQRIFASFMVHYATPASSSWSFQGFMWPLHSAPVGIKPLIC